MQRQADLLVTPPQCNSSDQEAGIRQISNFPIKFLLMLMGAMPFGSISVCKLEEEGGGVLRREGGRRRREREAACPNSASASHWPACQGQRPQRPASSSWHPPGVCTSIAPGAALTINILKFFKMQKTRQQALDHWILPWGNFLHFFRVVCIWRGWLWPQWLVASWADAGAELEQQGRRGWSASPRLLLVSGLARRHPPAASAPNIASSKQPTGPAVDAAWPARNVCIGSPPVACLVYLFTIGCHPSSGPAGLPSKQDDTAKGALPLNKANQW